MGRRRKHHGGSRLASDQIPGKNQNNICLRPCLSLVIITRPFAMIHERYSTPQPRQMQATTQSRALPPVHLIRSGRRNRTVRKQWNGMKAVKIQQRWSASQKSHLANRQRLIFHRYGGLRVKKCFDEVFADDGISLDPQRMPGDCLGRNRRPPQFCFLPIHHPTHFQHLRRKVDDHCVEVRGILHPKHHSSHSRRSIDGKSHPDRHVRIFILKSIGNDQSVTSHALTRRIDGQNIGP